MSEDRSSVHSSQSGASIKPWDIKIDITGTRFVSDTIGKHVEYLIAGAD
jgi:hypothetical protein